MKMGLKERGIFRALHPEANNLWATCCNLEKVCKDLHDPTVSIQFGIKLHQPFKPMLSERPTGGHEHVSINTQVEMYTNCGE